MINLPNVTLVAPTGDHIQDTLASVIRCCKKVNFGAVKFISHIVPENKPDYVTFEESVYPMTSYKLYNQYVFQELYRHFDTSHCLLVQYDSCILYENCWTNEFLNWDWIGAPWPMVENSYIANDGLRKRVGNGGFSLRSHRIQEAVKILNLEFKQEQGFWNEDGNFCNYSFVELSNYGIKYAPVELAARFSFESLVEENKNLLETFGHHRNFHWKKDYDLFMQETNQ